MRYHREINDLVYFFKCFKNVYKLNIFDDVSFRSWMKTVGKRWSFNAWCPFQQDWRL